ncbi:MAG: sodium ion-translocating decarboxylase subunit beta [Halanaerobium sp. MSAO_Bac5]|nr:MAG: sodium ion-translocating decarboxylase subunit beta [Halanaerobium sp. MSAO_Bac5]
MLDKILLFIKSTGYINMGLGQFIMIIIACILLYLAVVKEYEPLLLVPISFGMLLVNLPLGGLMEAGQDGQIGGLLYYLYQGDKLGIYPPIIFMGVGAWTDFGPMIAQPKTALLGAASQFGIFATIFGAIALGFSPAEAGAVGNIGGANGPASIFVATELAPHLLGPIAVAAYSYMALVPIIQPPIMKTLTTKEERKIKMEQLRHVNKKEKIIFPIAFTILGGLLVPSILSLLGSLMFGNLMREVGVVDRLLKTTQNALMNIITIFLGLTIGATASAKAFLNAQTMGIIVLGLVAFSFSTATGVLIAKLINKLSKKQINPLIGAAGVAAVPMSARVVQKVGQEENPSNHLLMHAMGANFAGVIGSAIAAGALIAILA